MTKVHFHVKGKEVVTDKIKSMRQLREAVLQARGIILELHCDNCGQSIKIDENHTCPDVIDGAFIDEPPQLPKPKE